MGASGYALPKACAKDCAHVDRWAFLLAPKSPSSFLLFRALSGDRVWGFPQGLLNGGRKARDLYPVLTRG